MKVDNDLLKKFKGGDLIDKRAEIRLQCHIHPNSQIHSKIRDGSYDYV